MLPVLCFISFFDWWRATVLCHVCSYLLCCFLCAVYLLTYCASGVQNKFLHGNYMS